MSTNSNYDSVPFDDVDPQCQHLIIGSHSTLMKAREDYLNRGGSEPVVLIAARDFKMKSYLWTAAKPSSVQGSIICSECTDSECICRGCDYLITSVEELIERVDAETTNRMPDNMYDRLRSAQGNELLPVMLVGIDKEMYVLAVPLSLIDEPDSDRTE
jgi:hypothetical protein